MSKLLLNEYTDRQIVLALIELPAGKFMQVINTISAVSESAQKRGKLVAQELSEDIVTELMRKLVEGE